MASFTDLQLINPLKQTLADLGYTEPTPIQRAAVRPLLQGRDLLAIAQTGTGKTAAFALPILQKLHRKKGAGRPRALVIAPTRELAVQIGASFERYGQALDVRSYVLYGGVPSGPQITALKGGVDVVVATPGRLLDLHRKKHLALDAVRWLVLDEADRLFDLGFLKDLRRIFRQLPEDRQTALFSATMPEEVAHLAREVLTEPETIEIAAPATPVDTVQQRVFYLRRVHKIELLTHQIEHRSITRGLVFVRTRKGARRLLTLLERAEVPSDAVHGDLSQAARTAALKRFVQGDVQILVATDVAARGLHIDGVTHVINFDLPLDADAYIHRIGRTARAGASGEALSFCDETEGGLLRDIERHTGTPLAPDLAHPWNDFDVVPDADASGVVKQGGRRKGKKRKR